MPEERTSFKPTRRPPPSPRATIQQAVPEDEEQKEAASDVRPAGDPYEETRRPAQRVRLSKAARLLGSARGARAHGLSTPVVRVVARGAPLPRARSRGAGRARRAAPFPGGAAETQRRRRYDATFLKRRAKAVAPSFLSTKHDDDELRYSLSNCPALDAHVRRAEIPRTSRRGDAEDESRLRRGGGRFRGRSRAATAAADDADSPRRRGTGRGGSRSVETGPAGTGTRSRWTGV